MNSAGSKFVMLSSIQDCRYISQFISCTYNILYFKVFYHISHILYSCFILCRGEITGVCVCIISFFTLQILNQALLSDECHTYQIRLFHSRSHTGRNSQLIRILDESKMSQFTHPLQIL